MLRCEIEFVNLPHQVFRDVKVAFNERTIDDQLCCRCNQLLSAPSFYLSPHRFEVTLHTVNANREAVFEREVFRVFREDGTIIALKRQVGVVRFGWGWEGSATAGRDAIRLGIGPARGTNWWSHIPIWYP